MGEDKITISESKTIKAPVEFNQDFDDVDLLSAAEKEALEADIDEGEGEPEAKAEEKTAAEAKPKAKEKKAAEPADDDAGEPEETEDEKQAKDPEAGLAPVLPDITPPTVLTGLSDEELKAVQDGLEDAKKKFSDGEIDYDEYLDARDELNQKLWAHNLAMQFSAESVDTRWEWEQETFLTAPENDWINNDDVVYPAFAATVNRIMSTEEGAVMPGPDLLAMAREEVAKRFSPASQAERVDAEEAKRKQGAIKNAKKKEATKAPPETLGGKPAAEIDEGVGEFEWLDKLDGEDYEKAVINLSDAQRARYEASV